MGRLPLVFLVLLASSEAQAECFDSDCASRCQSTSYCVLYFPGAASTPRYVISDRQAALRDISTDLDVVTFKHGSGLEYTANDFTEDAPVFNVLAANPGTKFITLCVSSGCNEARRLYDSGIFDGRNPLILEADPHQKNSPMPRELSARSGPETWVTFFTGTPDGAFSVGPPSFEGDPEFEVFEVQLNTYPYGKSDEGFDYFDLFLDEHVGSGFGGERSSEQLIHSQVEAPERLQGQLELILTYDVNYAPVTPGGEPVVTAPTVDPGGGIIVPSSGGGAGVESRPLWLEKMGR
ncbi:MAG: hypothetical protein GY937_16835 [bacterium]|nr:hypothetical protein [bacterium]